MAGDRDRVVLVARRDPADGRLSPAGSGFLLASGLALTARHVVEGDGPFELVPMRRVEGDQDVLTIPVERVIPCPGRDAALLRVPEVQDALEPMRIARLPEGIGGVGIAAVGFPEFAVEDGRDGGRQIEGRVQLGSDRREHRLQLFVDRPWPPTPPGTDRGGRPYTPWSGYSGAALLAQAAEGDGAERLVVGVFQGHHLREGNQSPTGIGLEDLEHPEAADFTAELAAAGVALTELDPGGGPEESGHPDLVPHERLVGMLRGPGRRSFLVDERLPFLGPGPGHPSDPHRLLAAIEEPEQRDPLLVGPAGAGKTRTALEAAELARRAGWRVLHVRARGAVTADDLKRAALSGRGRKVLFVLDYLDTCRSLDLRTVAADSKPAVRERGRTMALLGAVRPGLALPGAGELFREVRLSTDEPYRERVVGHILRRIAPYAVRRWGADPVRELCGPRPVIALLIADVLERRVAPRGTGSTGAPPDAPGPLELPVLRGGDLLPWLEERLRADGLLAGPGARGGPDGFRLGCAVAVAVCPCPRAAAEEAVDAVRAATGGSWGAEEVLGTLLSLGWLREAEGELETAHDIVADVLVHGGLLPPPGLAVREESARVLFGAACRDAAGLDRFAAHLRRLAVDLTFQTGEAGEGLAAFTGEWLDAHAARLGGLLRDAGPEQGARVLLTMASGAPWSAALARHWDLLVEPWFGPLAGRRAGQDFLVAALGGCAAECAPTAVGASFALIERQGLGYQSDFLLSALARRPGLDEAASERVEELALRWLDRYGERPAAHYLLKSLVSGALPPERRRAAAGRALRWLDRNRGPVAGFLLPELLARVPADASAFPRVVESALRWCEVHGRRGDAHYVLRRLGVRAAAGDLTTAQSMAWVRLVLDWAGGGWPSAPSLLHRLLTIPWLPDEDRARAGELALDRLAAEPERIPHAGLLVALLVPGAALGTTALPRDRTRQAVALAVRRLDAHPDEEGSADLLSALITRGSDHSLDHLTSRSLVDRAFRWLSEDGNRRLSSMPARFVLTALLRHQPMTAPEHHRVVGLTVEWLRRQPRETPQYGVVLCRLLQVRRPASEPEHPGIGPAREWLRMEGVREQPVYPEVLCYLHDLGLVEETGEAMADWLAGHPDSPLARGVIQRVIGERGSVPGWLTAEQWRRSAGAALEWLHGRRNAYRVRPVLWPLLRHGDLDQAQLTDLVLRCLLWLDEGPAAEEAGGALRAVLRRMRERDAYPRALLDNWLREYGAGEAAWAVLWDLLWSERDSDDVGTAGAAIADRALEWLDRHGTRPLAVRVIHGLLVRRAVTEAQTAAVLGRAGYWLLANGADGEPAEQLLYRIARRPEWADPERLRGVLKAMEDWAVQHGVDGPSVCPPFPLVELVGREVGARSLQPVLAEAGARWLLCAGAPGSGGQGTPGPPGTYGVAVLLRLLRYGELGPEAQRPLVELGLTWCRSWLGAGAGAGVAASAPDWTARAELMQQLLGMGRCTREEIDELTGALTARLQAEAAAQPESSEHLGELLWPLLACRLLTPEQARVAVDHAVDWLVRRVSALDRAAVVDQVLKNLLRWEQLTLDQVRTVIPRLLESGAGGRTVPRLRLLLGSPHGAEVPEALLDWQAGGHVPARSGGRYRARALGPVYAALLETARTPGRGSGVAGPVRDRVVAAALDWLGEQPPDRVARLVLRELLDQQGLGAEQSRRLVGTGLRLMRLLLSVGGRAAKGRTATADAGPYDGRSSHIAVLKGLLECPVATADELSEAVRLGRDWVAAFPHDEACGLLVPLLLQRLRPDDPAELRQDTARAVLAWAGRYPRSPWVPELYRRMLDTPGLDPGVVRRLLWQASDWWPGRRVAEHRHGLLRALALSRHLPGERMVEVLRRVEGLLPGLATGTAVGLLEALLLRSDAGRKTAQRAVVLAEGWLLEHPGARGHRVRHLRWLLAVCTADVPRGTRIAGLAQRCRRTPARLPVALGGLGPEEQADLLIELLRPKPGTPEAEVPGGARRARTAAAAVDWVVEAGPVPWAGRVLRQLLRDPAELTRDQIVALMRPVLESLDEGGAVRGGTDPRLDWLVGARAGDVWACAVEELTRPEGLARPCAPVLLRELLRAPGLDGDRVRRLADLALVWLHGAPAPGPAPQVAQPAEPGTSPRRMVRALLEHPEVAAEQKEHAALLRDRL
jgi:hypothetical protein